MFSKLKNLFSRKKGLSEDSAVYLDKDNTYISDAKEQAQKSLNEFITKLKNKHNNTDYCIKGKFSYNGQVEHMWVMVHSYSKNMFHGILNNEPIHIKNLKINDKVSIAKEDVGDWMIINNNDVKNFLGGFTIRPLLNKEIK